jgi:hypothetical protein
MPSTATPTTWSRSNMPTDSFAAGTSWRSGDGRRRFRRFLLEHGPGRQAGVRVRSDLTGKDRRAVANTEARRNLDLQITDVGWQGQGDRER